jgi:hypothetical protein
MAAFLRFFDGFFDADLKVRQCHLARCSIDVRMNGNDE